MDVRAALPGMAPEVALTLVGGLVGTLLLVLAALTIQHVVRRRRR
jgi:hypothetical protein